MAITPSVDSQAMDALARGSFVNTIQIESGNNPLRIVLGPFPVLEHWVPVLVDDSETGDKRATILPHNCAGDDGDCMTCIIADAETETLPEKTYSQLARSKKYIFAAISRVEQEQTGATVVRPFKAGWKIFKAIKELNSTPDWGDITKYDINIKRTDPVKGKGGFTDYDVIPLRKNANEPWSAEELAAFEVVDKGTYVKMAKPMTLDEMIAWADAHPLNLGDSRRIRNRAVVTAAAAKVKWPTMTPSFESVDEEEEAEEEFAADATAAAAPAAPAPAASKKKAPAPAAEPEEAAAETAPAPAPAPATPKKRPW